MAHLSPTDEKICILDSCFNMTTANNLIAFLECLNSHISDTMLDFQAMFSETISNAVSNELWVMGSRPATQRL